MMRNNFWVIIAGALLLIQCNAGNNLREPDVLNARLNALLNQKDFFKLEEQLIKNKYALNEGQRLYFSAFVDNAFNRNEASVNAIDTLFNNDASQFTDSSKAALLLLKGDSYFKLFRYAKAAQTDSMVLKLYSRAMDSEKIKDIKNDLLIRNALRHISPQQVLIKGNTTIAYLRDRIGLLEIPVRHRTVTYNCIFDTRANISSITQSYAVKLGLTILPVNYDESAGITGIAFKTGLGIADSLYIGNILVRNAVFQVMPDSILYLAPLKISLNIILGLPVIAGLKEVHIFKDGRMIIPEKQTATDLHNFALDGLDPVISLEAGKDTLSFNLDLGASTTDLYYAWFQKYKSEIIKEGVLKTVHYGGAGGVMEKKVYVMPSVELKMGDKKMILDSVRVLTKKIFPAEKLYGNIGNDFASQFNELILNFDKMYIQGN